LDTKLAAEELQQYLDFADIKDFNQLPPNSFEEINFCSSRNLSHCDEEENLESQTEDNDESFCPEPERDSNLTLQEEL
jgi:hypothetical protein